METITLHIGSIVTGNSGQTNDRRRKVQFEGEKLAEHAEYGTDRNGNITDSRGVTETLYRTADNRLIVYVEDWSHWRGEPNTYALHKVTESDLQVGGQFEDLGAEAGFGRPLTLDEALS